MKDNLISLLQDLIKINSQNPPGNEKEIIFFIRDYLKKLGNSLGTTVNHFNVAYRELGKIDKDIARITDKEKAVEPLTLEKPHELS